MAQAWADKCLFDHGQPEGLSSPYKSLGQNLFFNSGKLDIARVVQSWFEEKQDYDYETTKCTPGKACGHYTQVRSVNQIDCKPSKV